MPTWRCPHCGTPQEETARCWVCRRSSTACGTCRHFRRGIAGQLGYCGLDRRRAPLVGDEIRACWEAGAMTTPGRPALPVSVAPTARRDFVDVDPDAAPVTPLPAEPGWSLWAELEA